MEDDFLNVGLRSLVYSVEIRGDHFLGNDFDSKILEDLYELSKQLRTRVKANEELHS